VYPLAMAAANGSGLHATVPIPSPAVPPSVTAQGTVAAQIAEMKEYFRAFAAQGMLSYYLSSRLTVRYHDSGLSSVFQASAVLCGGHVDEGEVRLEFADLPEVCCFFLLVFSFLFCSEFEFRKNRASFATYALFHALFPSV
jgi:hypothetical protein